MVEAMAAMLDELMGKDRNLAPTEKPINLSFEDRDVCKHALSGYCPNDLFINTKMDIGPCKLYHDPKYKEQYEKSSRFGKLGYEQDWEAQLRRLQNDMDRKIKKNNDRLLLTQPEGAASNVRKDRAIQKVDELERKIAELLTKAELCGGEGKVLESQEASAEAERLRTDKFNADKVLESILNEDGAGPGGKAMEVRRHEVCAVCGCFLIVGDAACRVDEHLTGKLHSGFAKIRATLEELDRRHEAKREKEAAERRLKREKSEERRKSSKRDRSKERSRDSKDIKRRDGDRDRDRDRDRERSTRKRTRSRSPRASRHSHGSSGSSRRRSKSRDRHRERGRDRDSHRGDRGTSRRSRSPADKKPRLDKDKDRGRKRDSSKSPAPRKQENDGNDNNGGIADTHNGTGTPKESSKSPERLAREQNTENENTGD